MTWCDGFFFSNIVYFNHFRQKICRSIHTYITQSESKRKAKSMKKVSANLGEFKLMKNMVLASLFATDTHLQTYRIDVLTLFGSNSVTILLVSLFLRYI